MISRAQYVAMLRDLLSRDPEKVRDANRELYLTVVDGAGKVQGSETREADLVLAEIAD